MPSILALLTGTTWLFIIVAVICVVLAFVLKSKKKD